MPTRLVATRVSQPRKHRNRLGKSASQLRTVHGSRQIHSSQPSTPRSPQLHVFPIDSPLPAGVPTSSQVFNHTVDRHRAGSRAKSPKHTISTDILPVILYRPMFHESGHSDPTTEVPCFDELGEISLPFAQMDRFYIHTASQAPHPLYNLAAVLSLAVHGKTFISMNQWRDEATWNQSPALATQRIIATLKNSIYDEEEQEPATVPTPMYLIQGNYQTFGSLTAAIKAYISAVVHQTPYECIQSMVWHTPPSNQFIQDPISVQLTQSQRTPSEALKSLTISRAIANLTAQITQSLVLATTPDFSAVHIASVPRVIASSNPTHPRASAVFIPARHLVSNTLTGATVPSREFFRQMGPLHNQLDHIQPQHDQTQSSPVDSLSSLTVSSSTQQEPISMAWECPKDLIQLISPTSTEEFRAMTLAAPCWHHGVHHPAPTRAPLPQTIKNLHVVNLLPLSVYTSIIASGSSAQFQLPELRAAVRSEMWAVSSMTSTSSQSSERSRGTDDYISSDRRQPTPSLTLHSGFNVFTPTRLDYVHVFQRKFAQWYSQTRPRSTSAPHSRKNPELPSQMEEKAALSLLEIGTGTGVLSIAMMQQIFHDFQQDDRIPPTSSERGDIWTVPTSNSADSSSTAAPKPRNTSTHNRTCVEFEMTDINLRALQFAYKNTVSALESLCSATNSHSALSYDIKMLSNTGNMVSHTQQRAPMSYSGTNAAIPLKTLHFSVRIIQADLFPAGDTFVSQHDNEPHQTNKKQHDLVLFNPPWLPLTPRSAETRSVSLDAAVYDPLFQTITRFLKGVDSYLSRPVLNASADLHSEIDTVTGFKSTATSSTDDRLSGQHQGGISGQCWLLMSSLWPDIVTSGIHQSRPSSTKLFSEYFQQSSGLCVLSVSTGPTSVQPAAADDNDDIGDSIASVRANESILLFALGQTNSATRSKRH